MTKRILVTGAAGFIGKALCGHLLEQGYPVVAAVRQLPTDEVAAPPPSIVADEGTAGLIRQRIADIGPTTDWSQALSGVDAIVHLAGRVHVLTDRNQDSMDEYRRVNVLGTLHLARSAAALGVKRFVFISTIAVNGKTDDLAAVNEVTTVAPMLPYGISKWEAEQGLQEIVAQTGMQLVILRPPMVYGPGVGANMLRLMRWLDRSWPLPLASVLNQRSMIAVTNLCSAIERCLSHPGAAGNTYVVADNEGVSTPDLIRKLSAALGRPYRLFPFPPAVLMALARLAGRAREVEGLIGSLQIDATRIKMDLGWEAPKSSGQAIDEMVAWYRMH